MGIFRKHEGRVSQLLKQLIKEVNKNKEVMIDDDEKISETIGSERVYDSNSSGNIPFKEMENFEDKQTLFSILSQDLASNNIGLAKAKKWVMMYLNLKFKQNMIPMEI